MNKLKAFSTPVLKFTTDHRCRLGHKARQNLDDYGFCWAVVEYQGDDVIPISLHHSTDAASKKKEEEYQIRQGEIATMEMLEFAGFPTGKYSTWGADSKFAVVMVRREEPVV